MSVQTFAGVKIEPIEKLTEKPATRHRAYVDALKGMAVGDAFQTEEFGGRLYVEQHRTAIYHASLAAGMRVTCRKVGTRLEVMRIA